MSKGTFTVLDSFTGKQDTFLLHYEELRKLINSYKQRNILPFIQHLESTHRFYPVQIYRPFVAMAYNYHKTKPTGGGQLFNSSEAPNNKVRFIISDIDSTFMNDMVVRVVISGINGGTTSKFWYCDYPGIRLVRKTSFTVGDMPICSYTRNTMVNHNSFNVTRDKREAWDECLGHDRIIYGSFYNNSFNVNQVFPYTNGAQTPKPIQEDLELWIPLIFWFNLSPYDCFMPKLAKNLQKYIELELEALENILFAQDATTTAPQSLGSLGITSLTIKDCDLYTRAIYVDPWIDDLFTSRTTKHVIRVYNEEYKQLNMNEGIIELRNLKYGAEQFTFGFKPLVNDTLPLDWYKYSNVTLLEQPIPTFIINPAVLPLLQLVQRTSVLRLCTPVVNNVSLIIHGNTLYGDFNTSFFNKYIPENYDKITSAQDCSIYFVPFAHVNQLNPSGYVNLSKARELVFKYRNSNISITNPVNFLLSARCLAILEYSNTAAVISFI